MIYNALSRWGLLFLMVSILSACSTTEQALESMSKTWLGRSSDQFARQYGPPRESRKLTNGEAILSWRLSSKVQVAGASVPVVAFDASHTAINNPSEGVSMVLECNFQMVVSRDRKIKSIRILRDTTGRRETSRCNELFGAD